MIKTIDGIIEAARGGEPGIIAVAAAHDRPVIEAVAEARREGIAVPVLVGHADEIAAMLRELGEDPAAYEIIPGDTDTDCRQGRGSVRGGPGQFPDEGHSGYCRPDAGGVQ